MSEESRIIVDTTNRILTDLCSKDLIDRAEEGHWPQQLWSTLEQTGLTLAGISEAAGGSGGQLVDSLTVIRCAAHHAAPLPLAETFLAASMIADTGTKAPSGPLTVIVHDQPFVISNNNDRYFLKGEAGGVAWAAESERILVLADLGTETRLVMLRPDQCALARSNNIAGEPRYKVLCDDTLLNENQILKPAELWNMDRLRLLGALTRSAMMAGVLDSILEISVQYANDREQFGRPIGKFQAIQQQLAAMAGQVAASSVAADTAVEAMQKGIAEFEICTAKSRTGEAASICAEIAHQVHGAIGFTQEHNLHQKTRRLWAWRDEYGSESYWQERLGKLLCTKGADNLWSSIIQT